MVDKDYNIDINSEDKFEINIEDTAYTLEINPTDTFEIQLNEQGPQGDRGLKGDTGNGIANIEIVEETEEYTKYRINYTDPDIEPYDYTVYNGRNLEPAEEYIYEQVEPSNTWTIEHNLNTHPSITVVDSSGDVVDGDWNYRDNNTVILNFTAPFSGVAYLNYTR